MPSPSSVATTSLRTSPPPKVSECEEKLPLRALCRNMLAMWNESAGFFLQLVVVDDRVGAQPDLADGVGERGPRADVALEHRRLRAFARDDQQPRMRHAMPCPRRPTRRSLRSAAPARRPRAMTDDDAVAEKRGVQRRERVGLRRATACRGTARPGPGFDASVGLEPEHLHALGQAAERRQLAAKPAVHAHRMARSER